MTRPDSAEVRKQIVEVVGNCVYHALGLLETLEDERKALEKKDMTALNEAIENKSKCVKELRAVEDERTDLCATSGFPASPNQMRKMIDWCDETLVVANCWQHLMDIVRKCNSLNVTNGAIIRGRKKQIETSISIIRGGQARTDTYNRSGREPSGHPLRSIAKA